MPAHHQEIAGQDGQTVINLHESSTDDFMFDFAPNAHEASLLKRVEQSRPVQVVEAVGILAVGAVAIGAALAVDAVIKVKDRYAKHKSKSSKNDFVWRDMNLSSATTSDLKSGVNKTESGVST